MATRTGSRHDFEEFVAVCGPRLLRTAYLLTLDRVAAEDLLDLALARAWLGWERYDEPPQQLLRRLMVAAYLGWSPRRWTGSPGGESRPGSAPAGELVGELRRLSRRQRSAVVLRHVEGLTVEEAADVLGCSLSAVQSPAVERLAARAADIASLADGLADPALRERLLPVDRDGETLRRRRRLAVAGAVLAACALGVGLAVVVPRADRVRTAPLPLPRPVVQKVQPPLLAGHPLPARTRVEDVAYQYDRSEEAPIGHRSLVVRLPPTNQPVALLWATPTSASSLGDVVLSIDGDTVSRAAAGGLESGVVVSAHSPHRVTLRVTRAGPQLRVGLAIYRWPRP